jgi:hypothetical protein
MTQSVYLVWANHLHTHGIGEIVFTVDAALSGHCALKPTANVKAGAVNIIIDEFSNPYFVDRLAQIKKESPRTKYVFVATEFVTPVSFLGLEVARTFNFFGSVRDWANLLRDRSLVLKLTDRIPSYMQRRYTGFIKALPLCDLLAFVHPKIGSRLEEIIGARGNLISSPTLLYPELTFDFGQEDQLQSSPIGFDLTGTLTRYRRGVMRKLGKRFGRCGHKARMWRHVKFEESDPIAFSRSAIRFNYDSFNNGSDTVGDAVERDVMRADVDKSNERFLFNINPPQRARWQFSSPMRIARAALLGQIPAVTAKFGDHEIEDIAYLWDGTLERAQQVLSFRIDRAPLLEAYRQSVEHYNAVAKAKNHGFVEALGLLLSKCD